MIVTHWQPVVMKTRIPMNRAFDGALGAAWTTSRVGILRCRLYFIRIGMSPSRVHTNANETCKAVGCEGDGNNTSRERGRRSLKTHGQVQQDVRGDPRRDEHQSKIWEAGREHYPLGLEEAQALAAATEADWARKAIYERRCRLFPVRRSSRNAE